MNHVSEVMDDLVPTFADERGDWSDVLTRAEIEPAIDRRAPKLRRRLVVLIGVIAAASAAALAITAPWSGTPTLLERATAALTLKPGTILYTRLETIQTNPRSGKITRHLTEIWMDRTGRFRALLRPGPGGTTDEVGMTSRGQTLLFEPQINTIEAASFTFRFGDLAATIKKAITTGQAIDAGKTTLDGRTVEEIRSATGTGTTRIFIDPKTYDPVEATTTADVNGRQEPTVIRFLAYEHLPATPENLRLANIKALHPNAKLVLPSP